MATADDSLTTQVVSGDGKFDAAAMQHLSNSVKLRERGLSYAVVAILGPQSGGKSTLLNHLFHTNFRTMDALQGRKQTTQGIWMAKAAGVEPLTLVMDVEGSDSQERGEDGAAFEKQSALFAVAIADIVIINLWCNDIGRDSGSSKPLQRAVFQVLLRLFRTSKTTLMFVIRDKDHETPFDILERDLRQDVQKMWDSIPKPGALKDTPLTQFFKVEVIGLSHYKFEKELFKEETAQLRERFFGSILPGGLAYCDGQRSAVAASEFCSSTQLIWKTIKENKDLDLPAHRIMVATIRCEAIVNEKLVCLQSDNDWLALKKDVQDGAVSGFGERASTIVKKYLSEYDVESQYFDENVRNEKRHDLESKALQFVYPCYENLLKKLSSISLESFKIQLQQRLGGGEGFAAAVRTSRESSIAMFEKGWSGEITTKIWDWKTMDIHAALEQANWDALKEHEGLLRSIEAHASLQLEEKLRKLVDVHKKKLCKALKKPVRSLFDDVGGSTWASIRTLLGRESDAAGSALSSAIAAFELDEPTAERLVHDLKEYGTKLVEEVARERAAQALPLLKDRFYRLISKPKGNVTEEKIAKTADKILQKCLKYLSIMAVMRLDGDTDDVETVLSSALFMDGSGRGSGDPLASYTWDDVPPERTLITPIECRDLLENFKEEIDRQIRAPKDLFLQQADQEPRKSSPFRKAAKTFVQVIGAHLVLEAAKAIKEVLDDQTVACQLCGIRGHSAIHHYQNFRPQVQPPPRQWQLLESGDEFNYNHDGTHEYPLLTDGYSLPISHTDHGISRFEQPTQPCDSDYGRFCSQPTPCDSTVVCQNFQHQGHGGASGSGSA